MNLDERARQATSGLKGAVAASTLSSPVPGAAPIAWVPRVMAATGGAVVVFALVFLAMQVAPQTPTPATQPPDGTVIPDGVTVPTVPTDEVVTTTTIEATPFVVPETDAGAQPTTTEALDTIAPVLTITSPTNGQQFDEDVLKFTGMTEPGAVVAAGPYEADVAEDGSWSIVLILNPGSNRAVFTSTDAAGNVATAEVTVSYTPPVTTTTKPKEEPTTTTTIKDEVIVDFTANQVHGSCAETPPFDVFYGTAKPGSKVKITSEFGSGFVYANGDGQWELKVVFESAPANDAFIVTVKSEATGETKQFEFEFTP